MPASSQQSTQPSPDGVLQVFWQTLWLNLLVAVGKLVVGYMTMTLSLIADGFHSVLDASSNVAGIISRKVASQPPDSDHPYGHKKFEAFGAMIISFFLFLTSFNILHEAFARFVSKDAALPFSHWSTYVVVLVSMGISFWVSRYEARKGDELNNDMLRADAKHTMSDVYNSLSVIVALVAIQFHWYWVDVVVAFVIVVIVFRAGYEIITTHLGVLVDEVALDPHRIEALALEVPGVKSCHHIRSRGMQNQVFIDLHIEVADELSVTEGHDIGQAVEDKLKSLPDVQVEDVMVHIDPTGVLRRQGELPVHP